MSKNLLNTLDSDLQNNDAAGIGGSKNVGAGGSKGVSADSSEGVGFGGSRSVSAGSSLSSGKREGGGTRKSAFKSAASGRREVTFKSSRKRPRFRFGAKSLVCSVLALSCAATLNFPAMSAFATGAGTNAGSHSTSTQTAQSADSNSSANGSSSQNSSSAAGGSSSGSSSTSSSSSNGQSGASSSGSSGSATNSNSGSAAGSSSSTSSNSADSTATTDTSTEEVPAAQLSDDMTEQERADALKAEAQSLKGKADQVASRLNQMAASLETSYEDLNQVKTNLTQTQQEITNLETKIAETKARLDAAKEALSTTVKEMYCSGGEARFISVLLDSCDFETFVSTGFMFNKIASNWKQSIDKAGNLSKTYEEQKSSLSQAQQKQSSLQLEATKKGASVVQAMTDQATLLQNLDAETLAKARAFDSVTGGDYASSIGTHSSALNSALSASETWYANTGDSTSRDGSHPEAVDIARQYLGIDYVWAGASPSGGFDCSGLVLYVYAQLGINMPHFARSQYDCGIHIAYSALMPGDLVFFGSSIETIHHVGIYIGNGQFIHAPQTGDVVKISNLSSRTDLVGACRP